MSSHSNLSRRSFLRHAGALPLLGCTPLMAVFNALAACPTGDARTLVCVFLEGGADTFNFVVPGGTAYDEYTETRGAMAIADSNLLSANDSTQGSFGFNKLLPDLHQLYTNNQLAVLSNVGNLIRPTTPADVSAGISLPQSLFAHDAQRRLWQTASGSLTETLGWGGSIAERVATCNADSNVATSISIGGSSIWLTNLQERYISLSSNADIARVRGYDTGTTSAVHDVMNALLADAQSAADNPFRQEVGFAIERSANTSAALVNAVNDHPVPELAGSQNSLLRQLHLVARLISAREQLNMGRQVFFVNMGGWDTHNDQLGRFTPLLTDLNEALGSFQSTISGMGVADSVTTFTATDFGRTLTTNGDGTDHGWGGHSFVMGGSVGGGRIYGDFPSFVSNDNPDDAGDGRGNFAGRIIPQTSVAQYGATLANWMGATEAERNAAFPNLANFAQKDLGFML